MSTSSDPTAALLVGPLDSITGLGDSPDRYDGGGENDVAQDETETLAVPDGTGAEPVAPSAPAPAVSRPPWPKRLVRGRYRSLGAGFQLELRVDAGGSRPMNRISADFHSVSGGTVSYFGSFRVDAPTITATATQIKIEGPGTFTWAARAPYVRVTIPRVSIFQPQAPATVQFVTPPNAPAASYTCAYESAFFRTVQWEQDQVAGAIPFVSYDTAALTAPSGAPTGLIDVPRAYQLAGIEVQTSSSSNTIPVAAAGADAKWTDAELHAAMVTHFSGWANIPQWKVWLLVATEHVGGYRGIMFDYADAHQRQGCAVFYNQIQGNAAYDQRAQLRTYVHELGHAFNLLHSWQKNLADPPQPLGQNNGLGDLSWMNYTWNYQPSSGTGGDAAYWAAFPFQFTDSEVIHLRHAFYRHVVMGANAFGRGAAEVDPNLFAEPVRDRSGLALEVRSKPTFRYGEPVVVDLKLSATDTRGTETHGFLHPNDEFVTVAIQQPSGRTVLFRPLIRHCADEDRQIRLLPGDDRYESAYIGHGSDGAYFEQPGSYAIRAAYVAADGSRIISPVTKLRVRPPLTAEDVEVGELMMGDEQGQLLALLGSDSVHLQAGNEAFDEVLGDHGDHPLATYAHLVKGVNAARAFKQITADKDVVVREPEPSVSITELSQVQEASVQGDGVDNITLNFVMRTRARAEALAGDTSQAEAILDDMPQVFQSLGVKPQVIETVRRQAEQAKAELSVEG